MEACWYRRDARGLRIAVRVQPRAQADRLWGLHGDRLKIRIAAAPSDNAANERLRRFVASLFHVPPGAVRLLHGSSSRDKVLLIEGVDRLPPALTDIDPPRT